MTLVRWMFPTKRARSRKSVPSMRAAKVLLCVVFPSMLDAGLDLSVYVGAAAGIIQEENHLWCRPRTAALLLLLYYYCTADHLNR